MALPFIQSVNPPHLYNHFFENVLDMVSRLYQLGETTPFQTGINYVGDPGMVDDCQITLDIFIDGSLETTLYSEIISEDSNAAFILSLINHNAQTFQEYGIVAALGPDSTDEDATLLLSATPDITFLGHVPLHDPETAPDEDSIEYHIYPKNYKDNPIAPVLDGKTVVNTMAMMLSDKLPLQSKAQKVWYMSEAAYTAIYLNYPKFLEFYRPFHGIEIPMFKDIPIKIMTQWDFWANIINVSPYIILLTYPDNFEVHYGRSTDTYLMEFDQSTKTFNITDGEPIAQMKLKDPDLAAFACFLNFGGSV